MTNKPTLSTNTIIFFLVFICCALMASLFVYHSSHKPTLTTLANGNVTLFPVARDIKPFELVSTENKKFTQHDFMNHWTIVFFGFTHCSSICPTTLDILAHAYTQLHGDYPLLQMVFISIDPERDTLEALSSFTHSFSPALIGVTGKVQTIRKLQSQFGIFSDDQGDQKNHSTTIILINPHGEWAGVFKYGMTPDQFATAFTESMKHAHV